jgi:hypothetical protein
MPVDLTPINGNLESVLIDRLQIAVIERLRTDYPMVAQNMRVEKFPCPYADYVSYAFISYLANIHRDDKETITVYEYPATAWDFIKEKYAPKWFLKRWPVQYERKDVVVHSEKNFMCPHLPTEPTYPHALWLMMNQDRPSWWQ